MYSELPKYNELYRCRDSATRQDSEVSPSSEGSGIIATSDGYIITNAHVVSGADAIKVITSDGTTYEAELIGSDEVTSCGHQHQWHGLTGG